MSMGRRTPEEARSINETGRKSLDRLAQDMRIVRIWHEGVDGYWAQLADGFHWWGVSCLHEPTTVKLIAALDCVEAGDTY